MSSSLLKSIWISAYFALSFSINSSLFRTTSELYWVYPSSPAVSTTCKYGKPDPPQTFTGNSVVPPLLAWKKAFIGSPLYVTILPAVSFTARSIFCQLLSLCDSSHLSNLFSFDTQAWQQVESSHISALKNIH